jgi:septal ring-binding cell division protein DamX
MRFEIRSGGVGIILFGLVALSTMVFVFGLYEGYEIGIQSQSSSTQMATAYPLQGPPPADENSASAETPSGVSSVSGGSAPGENSHVAQNSPAATVPSPAASIAPSAPPSVAAATPEYSPERGSAPRLADAGVTRVKVAPPPSVAEATAGISPSPAAAMRPVSTEPAPAARHMPFNIQIQAAMDHKGADQMVQRLQQLGYQPHLVSTRIAGQTWYKVEVGPYASQDEAAVAEAELRQKYNSAFGGVGQPESPPDASGESTE